MREDPARGQELEMLSGATAAGGPTTIFALYASERNWLSLSLERSSLGAPVVGTLGWAAFLSIAPAAECGIVTVPHPGISRLCSELRALRRAEPFLPLVLVTGRPLPHDVATLGEVVRPPLIAVHLLPAIQRACTRMLLDEAAASFQLTAQRTPTLRRALVAACRRPEPVATVNELARLAGCHRHTLWSQWHHTALGARGLKLEDLVDWLILLHACIHRASGLRWGNIAAACGVHRHRLRRIAATRAAVKLRDLSLDGSLRMRAAFRRAVLAPAETLRTAP